MVEKSGKSASHIYARLSLLQLVPSIADAFTQERITASHANLLARLPQDVQAIAYEQCWRKDWQDKEPHLLPAKHLSAWIQANLYLSLADAPFDREDPTLNPSAGACVICPRRSGHNTSLFCDVQGDQCLDAPCYHGKVETFLDREVAAQPQLVQIENGWRNPKEQRPGAVQRGHIRELETVVDNPDAEQVMPCAAAKTAIVVYGKRVGTKLTVCTDKNCPVHDLKAAAEHAAHPAPIMAPAPATETEAEREEREAEYEQHRKEHEKEQQRREDERKEQFERQQGEYEAERIRREAAHKVRQATFERIVENAPAMFTAAQLRLFLHALINLDPYDFADDVAAYYVGDDENNQLTPEEVLASTLTSLPDEKLTGFALRLALTGHTDLPRESDFDFLAEAESVFVPIQSKKTSAKKTNQPAKPRPTALKSSPKKEAARKKAA